jgi:hypothetical protein
VDPRADITRARIEHCTDRVEYQRAKLELAGKHCSVVVAALTFASTVVAATAIVLTVV